jgi:protein-S-isoprenylcysteine O-methyltransferase Ste14
VTTLSAETAGVVARPPRLYLAFLGLGLLLGYLWPAPLAPGGLPAGARLGGGAALLAGGVVLMAAGMRALRRHGTRVETHQPTTALVTDGPYRASRNPIYVALTLLYAGVAVLADSAWALALLAPLLVVMRFGVVAREERYLERRFGPAYRAYRTAVRRWI